MRITSEELHAMGFWRAGTVCPDPVCTLRVQIDRDVHGFVVYVMIVNQEVVKAGKTETPLSVRMKSTFNALKNKMGSRVDHPRYQEKTFKEEELNGTYKGLWTKEGNRGSRTPGQQH